MIDALLGDPQVRFHPIRLMGATLSGLERLLRRFGLDGYLGGCALFLLMALCWIALPSVLVYELFRWNADAGMFAHVLLVFVLFALRDLLDHVWRVRAAARAGDLNSGRAAIEMLVGRDTTPMDLPACRRAAIESLSENFVDGFLSALFWYALAGIPGLLLFKVASTMDSMIGYKTERYLRFGWFGARLDDVMNYIPARLAWVLLGVCALPFRTLSAAKGWQVGLKQHSTLPGPNPGWSEATMAGLLQRKLIGPIFKDGALVTAVWLGDPGDPPAGSDEDLSRAMTLVVVASLVAVALTVLAVTALW